MKRIVVALAMMVMVLGSVPAVAGFLAEKADEGVYFVSYQRGQILRGSILFDREKKVEKRLALKSHAFCLESGYSYLKFPTLGEIAADEHLRAIWELGAGDESMNTSQVVTDELSLSHVHKSRRLLVLASEPGDGFEACRVD